MDKTIEDALSSYWVNFAKTGNPNGGNLPIWNTYNKQSGNIMVIGDTTLSSKEGFLKTELDFLGKL